MSAVYVYNSNNNNSSSSSNNNNNNNNYFILTCFPQPTNSSRETADIITQPQKYGVALTQQNIMSRLLPFKFLIIRGSTENRTQSHGKLDHTFLHIV
jgi:hypothetical protein